MANEQKPDTAHGTRVRSSRGLGAFRRFMESPEKVQVATFYFLLVTLALMVIVMSGQLEIYPRLARLEAIVESLTKQK